jgi:hypothetical protein
MFGYTIMFLFVIVDAHKTRQTLANFFREKVISIVSDISADGGEKELRGNMNK